MPSLKTKGLCMPDALNCESWVSLQNLELYHHAEKKLLRARGILASTKVRDPGMDVRASEMDHIDFLNSRVLALLDRLQMRRNPALP